MQRLSPLCAREVHKGEKVLVIFDSNHSFAHVLKEMEMYSSLVSKDSYMVVMDGTLGQLQDLPNSKPEWSEDNPLKAIHTFLERNPEWEIDPYYNRLLVTSIRTPFFDVGRRMAMLAVD